MELGFQLEGFGFRVGSFGFDKGALRTYLLWCACSKSLYDPTLSHRPPSSSFLGLPYRILNINHKKELLRGLWVSVSCGQITGSCGLVCSEAARCPRRVV